MAEWNAPLPDEAVEGEQTHVEDHNKIVAAIQEARDNIDGIELTPGPSGDDGHSPVVTWQDTTIVVDGAAGPDLKGEKGDPGNPEDLVDATPERRGLMSAEDKALLDELPTAPITADRLPGAEQSVPGVVTLNAINGIAATATETAMSDAVTVDEMFATVVLTASPTITTVLVAPYPMRITTITMVFDAMTLAAHPDNNLTVTWRKYVGSGTVLVAKSSATESITPRKPWRFDNATWTESARTLQEGEMLNLGFTAAGTGSTVVFPVHATIGYEPL